MIARVIVFSVSLFILAITLPMWGWATETLSQDEYNWLVSEADLPQQPAKHSHPVINPVSVRQQPAPRQVAEIPSRGSGNSTKNGNMLRQLPWGIRKALLDNRVNPVGMGAFILRVGDRQPMLVFNENQPHGPASVMKLVTTYAALGTLGVNYRWPTEVYMTGNLKAGTLIGNLFIKGYGAPDFKTEDLRVILKQLRRKGIRNVNGNIVLDSSYFRPPNINPGAFDGQRYETYNAQPDALLFNEKTSEFIVQNVKGRATVYTPAPAQNIRIVNHIRSVRGRCRGRARSPHMTVTPEASGYVVTFSGRFSTRCGKRTYKRAITDSPSMIFATIQRYWKQDVGGAFQARLVKSRVPGNAQLLYRHQSAPLHQIIKEINKDSNNLMARQLMLTIGARKLGVPSTPQKGEAAIKQWLNSQGLKFAELRIENGSGLSRWSTISARHIGELLLHAYRSPYRRYFMDSLAVAGKDGTLKKRFRGTPIAGKGRFKTGSLRDARAIAGYVRGAYGKDYIISILHNGTDARHRGKKAHDTLIEWAYWHGNPPQKLARK